MSRQLDLSVAYDSGLIQDLLLQVMQHYLI